MKPLLIDRILPLLLATSILFLSCSKKDPFIAAETHLKQKVDYLNDKAKMLQAENFQDQVTKGSEASIFSKITNVKSFFPKSKPMQEPWAAMITFSMIHTQGGSEVMKENFRVIFEFETPYWIPTKMENEQIWRKTGNNVPWKEITKESNHDAWTMINSLLGLSGP